MADDGIAWPGGFGTGAEWYRYVKPDDVPQEVREAFEWFTQEHAVT